ncbi:THUMP domain-containing protein 2 [Nothobranchius furzeri]|uniref:THUMP domain containing 2 n=2 Tax=Nothobranchius furzeri TaxID=105023 RepID=A0A1A8AG36_NOTFU|nr:THUMP domain containing 2 [Nothobranchius furzeri]
MNDTRSDTNSVRYYCTAGNGMESFLVDEVKRKLAAKDVLQFPGKVLFSSSAMVDRVRSLKAAERLFLLLKQDSPLGLPAHTSPARASYVLQSRLFSDRNQWTGAVRTWSRLQGELAANRNADKTTAVRARKETEGGNGDEEEGKFLVESRKRTRELRVEEWESKKLRSDKQINDKEEEADVLDLSDVKDVEENEAPDTERSREIDTNQISGTYHTAARPEHNVGSCSRTMDQQEMENVSFRINCKCSGSLSRCLSAQEISKLLGAGLSRLLGWKADLKRPQLEINAHLSNDYILLGIPLTRSPLASRSYIKTTGLRSTIAWAMASLAQIQPGFCVVDPMCGVGTILIEAAQEHKAACFLGVDIDDGQLQKANENKTFAELGSRVHLLKASSMGLPLPSCSIDAVICDLPLGRKFDTKINMAVKLPLILSEMERILCVGGTLVVLLSPQLSSLMKKLLAQKHTGPTSDQKATPPAGMQESEFHLSSLRHQMSLRVSLGAIDGLIHKYVKT